MYYFRPVWTCGRYDQSSHSAIFYNLLEGLSFFFENESADVIGEILKVTRGTSLSVEEIAKRTQIDVSSLNPFLQELKQHRLLFDRQATPDIISNLRKEIYNSFKPNATLKIKNGKSDSEKLYADRCNAKVTFAMLELTYRCSESCIHCYNPGAARNENEQNKRGQLDELDLEDYKRIIDELYDEGVIRICLSGGDPFSKSIIWDILDYLYQKDIAIEVYTNGQNLIGQEQKLADYFPCDIGISIYSSEAKVHDNITKIKGSFLKSWQVLQRLSEYAIPLCIKCCIMRPNLKTYMGVADIANKFGATLQLECAIFDAFDGDICVSKYLRLNEQELELTLRDENNPLYIGLELPDLGKIPKDLNDIACRAGVQCFCITPEGQLIPCSSYHASLGSLKKQHLHDLLINNSALEELTHLKLLEYEECGQHDYCDYCKLCPGLNFAEHGTPLKAAENNCFIAKIRWNLAMKLKKGQDPLKGKTLQEALQILPKSNVRQLEKVPTQNNYNKKFRK